MSDKEFLLWLYNRLVQVYGESQNADYVVRLRKIIDEMDDRVCPGAR